MQSEAKQRNWFYVGSYSRVLATGDAGKISRCVQIVLAELDLHNAAAIVASSRTRSVIQKFEWKCYKADFLMFGSGTNFKLLEINFGVCL